MKYGKQVGGRNGTPRTNWAFCMKTVYLMAPYSHPNPAIREQRTVATDKYAARLMSIGINVFSPLSHSHRIAMHMHPSSVCDSAMWTKFDLHWMPLCTEAHILTLDGWLQSSGIEIERRRASDLSVPVFLVDPETYEIVDP